MKRYYGLKLDFCFSVSKTLAVAAVAATAVPPDHSPKAISANDCNIYAKCVSLYIKKVCVGNLSLDASFLTALFFIYNQKHYYNWKLYDIGSTF